MVGPLRRSIGIGGSRIRLDGRVPLAISLQGGATDILQVLGVENRRLSSLNRLAIETSPKAIRAIGAGEMAHGRERKTTTADNTF